MRCDMRMTANSFICVTCKKRVPKRCSGVKSALHIIERVFQCKKGTGDVAEVCKDYCVIYGIGGVASYGYLGDDLNAGGVCWNAMTASIRVLRKLSAVMRERKWAVKMKGSCIRHV